LRHSALPVAVVLALAAQPAAAQVEKFSTPSLLLGNAPVRAFTFLGDDSWIATFEGGTLLDSADHRSDHRLTLGPPAGSSLFQPGDWSLGVSRGGTYFGTGRGGNAGLSFSDARWGSRTAFFNSDAEAGGALFGLAPRADFATIGLNLNAGSRFALSVMSAAETTGIVSSASAVSARAMALSYTFQAAANLSVSLTSAIMDGRNLVLGGSNNALRLGPASTSTSLGAGLNLNLGSGFQLGFDAALAQTDAVNASAYLLGTSSSLSGSAVSLALSKANVLDDQDSFNLVLKKPLSLGGGDVSVPNGVGSDNGTSPIIKSLRKSIVPTGQSETDLGMGYSRQILPGIDGRVNFNYRMNADNIAGATDTGGMIHFKTKF
jgi:hypothetical protein